MPEPYRTSSNTKNSASGPKKAVSAMPEDLRYSSALRATERGSRLYGFFEIGSYTSQISDSVGIWQAGSMNALSGSGMSSMSDSWISWNPRIEDPSNPSPSLNTDSSNSVIDT